MAQYGLDEENAQVLSEEIVAGEKIVAHGTQLGQTIEDYMTKTVAKILYAKNMALLNDDKKQLADKLKQEQSEDDETLEQTYLDKHIVEGDDQKPITNLPEMENWVKNNFYFCLSDIKSENAWIYVADDNPKSKKNTIAITTKMIESAENASQFEGVIAHELGHFFVNEKYGSKAASRAGSINEKMADKHALDCLSYMNKNPDEYAKVMNKLYDLQNMSELDRIISGIVDEHGSPSSRLQDIEDYNEAVFGDYIDEYMENTEALNKTQEDDVAFAEFQGKVKDNYAGGRYVGYLESLFMADEKFASLIDSQSGRIDFSKVPYEQTLDKLIELTNDKNFGNGRGLVEASELISRSNSEGLEFSPELTEKINTFLAKAADCECLNQINFISKQSMKQEVGESILKDLNWIIEKAEKGENIQITESLAEVLLKEAKSRGENLSPEVLAQRIEKIALETGEQYDGKEKTREFEGETYQSTSILHSYNGQKVWIGMNENSLLLLHCPNSAFLSDELKQNRAREIISQHELLYSADSQLLENVDSISMALAYPQVDFAEFKKTNQENKKQRAAFLERLEQEKHPLLKTPSFMYKDVTALQELVDGKDRYVVDNFPKYAKGAFDLPKFVMPEEKEAIGKPLPWQKEGKYNIFSMEKMGLKLKENVSEIDAKSSDFVVMSKEEASEEIVSKVEFPRGEKYDFYADENGIIMATGEKARELNALKNNKNAQERNQEISENLQTKLNVLDAVTLLSEIKQRQKDGTSSEKDRENQNKLMTYLTQTPDLERHLVLINLMEFDNDLVTKEKELDYNNMSENAPQIQADFEALQQSYFVRQYAGGTQSLSGKNEKEKIETVWKLNMGDKTVKMLQDIIPVISDVMEKRAELFANEPNLRRTYMQRETRLDDKIAIAVNRAHLEGQDALEAIKVRLALRERVLARKNGVIATMTEEKTGPGIEGDEKLYVKEKVPYYENLRTKYHMLATENNPEALYANLSATFSSYDELGDEETQERIQRTKARLDENKKMVDVGSRKLNCCLAKNEAKLAEYEVMRYINTPNNPPLDIIRILDSYPKYESNSSSGTDAFRAALGNYILESKQFKEMDFYQKNEVFDQMLHKNLFDKKSANKFEFLEKIKDEYIKLPEEKKESAAIQMLQDREFSYEKIEKPMSFIAVDYNYTVSNATEVKTAADYPPIRNFFATELGERFAQRVGKEPVIGEVMSDGRIATEADIKNFQNQMVSFMNMVNTDMTKSGAKEKLFTLVADKVEAQKETSERLNVAIEHVDSDNDLSSSNEAVARSVSSINQFLDMTPDANLDMVDFLTRPYSPQSADKFRDDCHKHVAFMFPKLLAAHEKAEEQPLSEEAKKGLKNEFDKISNEDLSIIHGNFWEKDLNERAVVMQRLLGNYAKNDVEKSVDIVVDKYMTQGQPYYQETKDILKTLYARGSGSNFYRKDQARFMLGAMLGAQKPAKETDSKNMGIGQALAMFCSNNGPAWVKFGQALSNIPNLPDDIRKPMSELKDKAVNKTRWGLFDELKTNLPPEKFESIKRVGKVLGAGSFFSSVAIEEKDGSKYVLQMMQPNAKKNANNEFKKIMRTIKDLTKANKMYGVLDKIVERANESTKTEVDINKGFKQYVEASKNYGLIDKLEVNGVKFKLNLVPWTDKNQTENGDGFKQMKFAEGKSLNRLEANEEEKRILAAGYVATELGILLGGRAWDIDRHSGQQNFNITRDETGKMKEVEIGIFDTGALRQPPTEEEKAQVAGFYSAVLKAALRGDDINEVMFKEVQNLEDKGINAAYVSDVQRGCIALSDMCEYQKEEKNSDGKIIKASKSFDGEDFSQIMGAVMKSGMVDHKIIDPLLNKMVKDKQVVSEVIKMQAKKGFNKLKQILSGKNNDVPKSKLQIEMEAKGLLQARQESIRIDSQTQTQSGQNEFALPEKRPLSKTERENSLYKEKSENKISRNIQAMLLKKARNKKINDLRGVEKENNINVTEASKNKILEARGISEPKETNKRENTNQNSNQFVKARKDEYER